MKQEKQYKWINRITLLFAIGWFVFTIWERDNNCQSVSRSIILIMILTSILLHSVKVLRLYMVLYGKKISFMEHIRQYCKVIPISMVLPFKLGEIFRMYCYGYQMNNFFDGIVVILIDRFVDTLGLVTIILFIRIVSHTGFPFIFYLLLMFLVVVIGCYLIFPNIYFYWKHELLRARLSKRKNNILYFLEKLYFAYSELTILIKGRFILLYLLSLIAWAIEISGGWVCNQLIQYTGTVSFISEYLTSALLGTELNVLKKFVFISILLLFLFYFVLHRTNIFIKKEDKNEKSIGNIR